MKTKKRVISLFKKLGLNLEYVDSNQKGQENYAVKRIIEGKETSLFYVIFFNCSKAKFPHESHFIVNGDGTRTWTKAPLLMVSYDSLNESISSICVLTQKFWLSPKPKTFEITLDNVKLMINLLLYVIYGKVSRITIDSLYYSKSEINRNIKHQLGFLSIAFGGLKHPIEPWNRKADIELITLMDNPNENNHERLIYYLDESEILHDVSVSEVVDAAYDQLLFQNDNEKD